nr:polymorphic toxin-type HINT domain-containing protein [Terrisporobacter petrolearius]
MKVAGEVIEATEQHVFYIDNVGWIPASMIEEGDVVVLQSGDKSTVEKIDKVVHNELITVYNFEVEDFHTYFVSDASVLVHNINCDTEKTIEINLKYKKGWTNKQKKQARKKVKALSKAKTVKTSVKRKSSSASSRYRSKHGSSSIPKSHDVDHMIELQLGGADELSNMKPLDKSVNRSLGSQIHHAIKNHPEGTVFGKFTID